MNFFKHLLPAAGENQATVGNPDTSNLNAIISNVKTIVSAALGILTASVVILAIFIAYKFFTADTEDKRKNAKQQLIYAIIGVVVLIALLIFAPMVVDAVKGALSK